MRATARSPPVTERARTFSRELKILFTANPRYRLFAYVAVGTAFLYALRSLLSGLVAQSNLLHASDVSSSHASGSRHDDWRRVITAFLDTVPPSLFSSASIEEAHSYNMSRTCVLVAIANGNMTINRNGLRRDYLLAGRFSSVEYMLNRVLQTKALSDLQATFMVDVSDGTRPPVAAFVSARHWETWPTAIPIPLGNPRGIESGIATPLEGWDAYIQQWVTGSHDKYPWHEKRNQAVFRGCLRVASSTLGSCNSINGAQCIPSTRWNEVNRGVMYEKAAEKGDLFDISFTSVIPHPNKGSAQLEGAPPLGSAMPFQDYQKYKLVLNIGSNQDWAERERSLLFMNSVVVHHMAETQEFFTPLLRPWEHVIPVSLDMSDLVSTVEYALRNDSLLKNILQNQHAFAKQYLSEEAMEEYWIIALTEYAKRQLAADSKGKTSWK